MLTKQLPALLGLICAAATSAGAATINTSNATCISGCAGVTSGTTSAGIDFLNNLQVGTVYKLENASFVDGNGDTYDARVEVLGLSDGASASTINVQGVNEWKHLQFTFVEDDTLTTMNTDGVSTTVVGAKFINVFDIDSNFGTGGRANFTDVVGVNAEIVGLGAALEEGGFLASDAPLTDGDGADINYARLDPEFVPGEEWKNEPNFKPGQGLNEEDFVATFSTGGDLEGFELVWGSTGAPSNNVRGWELSIDADPVVAPVPLPASLPLLLAGMGLIGALRRTRA